jgi:hypothetical protein
MLHESRPNSVIFLKNGEGISKTGDFMKKIILSLSLSITLLGTSLFAAENALPSNLHAMTPATPASDNLQEALSGKVLQTMNSGGYSYIYLQKKSGGEIWIAVPEVMVKVDDQLTFKGGTEMPGFESKSLKRKFDTIIFSAGILNAPRASAKTTDTKTDMGVSPGSNGAVAAKEAKISVAKATGPNATTIEDAFGNSTKLDKEKVVIRGKVVKVSTGIMGKNWIHIQDGSGSQAKSNHNLVCTSDSIVDVGDVVTVSGILAKDRDFGAGYSYAVIIEQASFEK